jgi:hypothetical protein
VLANATTTATLNAEIVKSKHRAAMSMHRVSEHREEDEDDYDNDNRRKAQQ